MSRTSVSVVVYGTPVSELLPLFQRLQTEAAVAVWVVVDNAASERPADATELRRVTESTGGRYIPAERNLGFGAGHNLAVRSLTDTQTSFHLMVNPDITFAPGLLSELEIVMDTRQHVGSLLPKVLYPDGSNQYLIKLLPTPLDFALRRFAPAFLQRLAIRRMDRYELKGLVDTESDRVPFLSGCFMFTRRSVFEAVCGFDDRFFLYLEDVDLCRRMASVSTLLYYPGLSVVHEYHRGAHKNRKLMFLFLQSSWRYFAKWGWIFDSERRRANADALTQLRSVQEKASGS